MNPAVASLIALLAAIVLSMTTRINIGVVAIAMAWLIGVYVAGISTETILSGFPSSLFITLTGVTLLFACAEANGTLKTLAHRAFQLVRGKRILLPILFFFMAFLISTVGPGAIASVALIVPLAMAISERAGIPHLLTALMVANGANAGNLSPISAVGVIANQKMAEAGLTGHEWKVWGANFAAHFLVSIAAYLFFSRWKHAGDSEVTHESEPINVHLTRNQIFTVVIVIAWVIGALALKLNLGLSAFTAAALIFASGCVDEKSAFKKVQWSVIIMVCGVSVLIVLLEKTGGMELFTGMLARMAGPSTINGVIAFITGAISTYSSTSGVVLPAFLPMVPGIVEQLKGGDPLAIALSINVGSAIVDVSPLSTLGALCVASVSDSPGSHRLFRHLLIWGLSMTIFGAAFCLLFSGPIARL